LGLGLGVRVSALTRKVALNSDRLHASFRSFLSDHLNVKGPNPECGDQVFARSLRCRLCNTLKPGLSPEELARVPPPMDCYDMAKMKNNMLVWVRLKCRHTGDQFCVSTYHMPCEFRRGSVMTIHAAAVARLARRLSQHARGGGGARECCPQQETVYPYVLCGDFNIKPNSPQYQLLTTGDMTEPSRGWKGEFAESWHDHIPSTPEYDVNYTFESHLDAPLVSAYHQFTGAEPDFTNNVISTREGKLEEVFIETIDYIFCSKEVKIVNVEALPHRKDVAHKGPLPWDTEPSDHLPLVATLMV
jgi:endonuclease/exonuclease/phosphatase family metal-dependent hydrolase